MFTVVEGWHDCVAAALIQGARSASELDMHGAKQSKFIICRRAGVGRGRG